MKKLNVTFCSYPDFSNNSRVLYEYMYEKYSEDMNLVWIIKEKHIYSILKDKMKCYLLGSKEFYNYIKKTDVFFTTHANLIDDKPEKAIYIELWHGIGPKSTGYLDKNLTDDKLSWYEKLSRNIDFMIVPNEFWKIIYSSIFNIPANRILTLGMPKLERMLKAKGKENLKKILPDLDKYKKIIFYFPTFRNTKGESNGEKLNTDNIINFQKYEEEKLINFLNDNL